MVLAGVLSFWYKVLVQGREVGRALVLWSSLVVECRTERRAFELERAVLLALRPARLARVRGVECFHVDALSMAEAIMSAARRTPSVCEEKRFTAWGETKSLTCVGWGYFHPWGGQRCWTVPIRLWHRTMSLAPSVDGLGIRARLESLCLHGVDRVPDRRG